MAKQLIIPHLWFDKEAKEAANFYSSLFPNSNIKNITTLHGTPSGDCDIVSFDLCNQSFMAISAGPFFKFNPSISFQVKCKTKQEVDALWKSLSLGGSILMEVGSYPWSERYGWIQDKYGLSWQITYATEIKQVITPVLMFTNKVCGKAEEAAKFYTSVFKQSGINSIERYHKGEGANKEGTVKYASFTLHGQEFAIMDSAESHSFDFNEAVSLLIGCENQKDIDYYWDKFSYVPEAEQCGWVKDRYGISWQINATEMDSMMATGDREQLSRLTQAFLKMKKFDISALKKAFNGIS